MARLAATFAVVAIAAPTTTQAMTTEPKAAGYHGISAEGWAYRYHVARHQLYRARVQLRRHFAPTVTYALRLASAVSGVSYWSLRSVAWCESTLNPFATNGRYRGLFQLGWAPFGLDPFEPVANAISAALTVVHDG